MATKDIRVDFAHVNGQRTLAFTDNQGNDASEVSAKPGDLFHWHTSSGDRLELDFDNNEHPFPAAPDPVSKHKPGKGHPVTKSDSRHYKYTATLTDAHGTVSVDPKVIIDGSAVRLS